MKEKVTNIWFFLMDIYDFKEVFENRNFNLYLI